MRNDQQMDDTQAKVDALRKPGSYPEAPERVEVIETHKSWVFLAGAYVYKMKKAIRFNSVDHRQLEARYDNCMEEVRLNRRLAGDVYVGVVPLTRRADGRVLVDGSGEIIDWLVQMRRLPEDRMLDCLIRGRRAIPDEIHRVALLLAEFYQRAAPLQISAADYRQAVEQEIAASESAFTSEIQELVNCDAGRIVEGLWQMYRSRRHALDQRAQEGHIVEGHGDLRPEHICCLEPRPVVIDCLEFERRLRIVDPLDELEFLALDCERLGARWIGHILFLEYENVTGDQLVSELVPFYRCYRAAMWARLAAWRLAVREIDDAQKWIHRCRSYLRLASESLNAAS